MKRRAAALSCVLWLGCGGSSSVSPAADGGRTVPVSDAGETPASRSTVTPMDAASGAPDAVTDAAANEVADASAPDAAAAGPGGLIPVKRIYPDGGGPPPQTPTPDAGPLPATDADGGAEEPEACNASSCWCEHICEQGLALQCAGDEGLASCVAQCDAPSSDCYDYFLRVLACKAELPRSAYSCDPDLLVFVVGGCIAQEQALQDCRRS